MITAPNESFIHLVVVSSEGSFIRRLIQMLVMRNFLSCRESRLSLRRILLFFFISLSFLVFPVDDSLSVSTLIPFSCSSCVPHMLFGSTFYRLYPLLLSWKREREKIHERTVSDEGTDGREKQTLPHYSHCIIICLFSVGISCSHLLLLVLSCAWFCSSSHVLILFLFCFSLSVYISFSVVISSHHWLDFSFSSTSCCSSSWSRLTL